MMATQNTLIVPCPDCGHEIEFEEPPDLGDKMTCADCWAYLVVTQLNPVQLSWDTEELDEEDGAANADHRRGGRR